MKWLNSGCACGLGGSRTSKVLRQILQILSECYTEQKRSFSVNWTLTNPILSYEQGQQRGVQKMLHHRDLKLYLPVKLEQSKVRETRCWFYKIIAWLEIWWNIFQLSSGIAFAVIVRWPAGAWTWTPIWTLPPHQLVVNSVKVLFAPKSQNITCGV